MHRYLLRRYVPVVMLLAVLGICQPRLHGQTGSPVQQAFGTITGEVRDESGAPIADLAVRIDATTFETSTTNDGSFRIANVPYGSYRLTVTGDEYATQSVDEITVGSGATRLRITVRGRTALTRDPVLSSSGHVQPAVEAVATVAVLRGTDLTARNITTIDRALEYAPGMEMNGSHVDIRGASGFTFGAGNRALLLIDGIPYTTPDDGRLILDAIPVCLIDQIEVVHGAASSLYGPGAESGVINVITRRPVAGTHGELHAHVGVYSTPEHEDWHWWGLHTQRFDGAEGLWTQRTENVGITVAGSYGLDESFRQFDNVERYNANGSIDWIVDNTTDLKLTALLSHNDHGGYLVWRSVDSALSANPLGDLAVPVSNATTSITGQWRRLSSDGPAYTIRAGTLIHNLDDRRGGNDLRKQQSSSTSYFANAEWTSRLTPLITVNYGGGVVFDDITSKPYGNHLQRTTSLRAQMEFTNREDITAMIRTRFDAVDELGSGNSEFHLSPGLGVTYRPSSETSFRLSLGRGYRMPTIAERHINAIVAGVRVRPNLNLNSEVSWHGEIGITQETIAQDVQLRIDCALYVDEYFSMIEPVLNPSDGNAMFQNLTRGRMLGADLQLRGELTELGLSFVGDLGVVSARDLKLNRDLVSRPASTGHFSLAWHNAYLSITSEYRYVSRITAIDSLLQRIIPDSDQRVAAHNVDLHIGIDMHRILTIPATLRLTGRNILQHYSTDGVGSLSPIRNFVVGLEAKF